MAEQVRLVAAIDFGTHGTGFAWSFASERDREPVHRRINLFDDWEGQPTNYVKNLTAVLLDSAGEVLEWGHQASRRFQMESREHPEYEYAQGFKMGLLPETGKAVRSASPAGATTSPRRLITSYLKAFRRFALDRIIAGSRVQENEILWVLTVPAIWQDRERQIMRDCAVEAGFPAESERLLIAIEPEVAALYCRFDTGHSGVGAAGDRFMVVDAGGGTVDITAYEKTEHGLTEIGYPSGGSLGSTYIDRYLLETVLPERLGNEFMKRARHLEPGAFVALSDEWERNKRSFDPENRRSVLLQMSHRLFRIMEESDTRRLAAIQNGVDDAIELGFDEVMGLFDHVTKPILKLVDEQLRQIGSKSVQRVMLVGGFAQSRYLQERLRSHLSRRTELVVPSKPSWAVLLGAVHLGLEPTLIRGRRTRFTYGVATAKPFDIVRDPANLRLIKYDGTPLCDNRFDSFVEVNEVVEPGREVRRSYFPVLEQQREMSLRLFVSEKSDPRYVTDDTCRCVGELTMDMTPTLSHPPDERCIEMTMIFGGTEVEARARDVRSGKEVKTHIHFS
ncbi:Hsp70 family protein [Streptomyces sp. NBC_00459]|uniref:Hsp70 family protein n=1 Tax=Streptomyces sp. NBC_00459 TaxID=2975749 RepID=UPI002E16CF6A